MTDKQSISAYAFYYVYKHLRAPVRLFDQNSKVILEYQFIDFSDELYYEEVMRESMPEAREKCVVISIEQAAFYACIPVNENIAMIGPVRFPERYLCHCCLHLDHFGSQCTEESFLLWHTRVEEAAFRDFIECMILLSDNQKTKISAPEEYEKSILKDNFLPADTESAASASLSRLLFDNREKDFVHNPYSHELREVSAVERGDTEELEKIINEQFLGRYGTLSNDPLRQEINMGIIVVTLSSRAAIRGGLSSEMAYYLSDIYIQALEKCRDPLTAKHTAYDAERHYTRLVKELRETHSALKESENRHINRCKNYVYAHLHRKLQVQDIASAIGLEPNYLSGLFKKNEGITLKEYIINAKVKLIQNLLTYSDYSYIEIASYLGFSSQSHMGDRFRRVTGMTPRKYREKYQKEDFLHEYK